ncbi:ferric reductase-like transmembrane domain-containing protein [Amaricoccus sp.]|uniref:ferredoxin reductase family protein n=1 Tax=Amaricoccus sp. TaxID=1872485 RepID=UPI001B5CEA3A|nr:ferric reductase-like transmembrane domain-containing protein [Amaricoccus sp.]MBP7241414.1 ferric reductase-like transmembrane domain-containing protein [Amaricoccus sp.]
MRPIKVALWGGLALLAGLWLLADPGALWPSGFFALRGSMVQLSGILAIGCMSLAMILALRPRWPERWLGGLDKMYRLHKWLGIAALVLAVFHWLWAQGPKWAGALGLLQRPARGTPPEIVNPLERLLQSQRGLAEGIGEWAFYAAVALIVVALAPRIPYRHFYGTHRLLAVAYLVLAFHAVVLTRFAYWTTPLGLLLAVLLVCGVVAAVVALLRRVGAGRKVQGTVTRLHYYPDLRVLEGDVDAPQGWPGHKPGQFAFITTDEAEGAHPFTIASAWNPSEHRLTFITKELGDYTRRLPDTLRVGQPVRIEGPYGCFTFDDDRPRQIWIGGGIGITPFVARMKQIAMDRRAYSGRPHTQAVDLFHTTADYSEEAIGRLRADAAAAGVYVHVLHDARDGQLSGERIREAVPDWREASVWFCGPVGFGAALRADFAGHGFDAGARFHQELFAMR